MKEILYNLALIDTINFCKTNGIDCSGTYLTKADKGFIYTLSKSDSGKVLVAVKFIKNGVPQHFINNQ